MNVDLELQLLWDRLSQIETQTLQEERSHVGIPFPVRPVQFDTSLIGWSLAPWSSSGPPSSTTTDIRIRQGQVFEVTDTGQVEYSEAAGSPESATSGYYDLTITALTYIWMRLDESANEYSIVTKTTGDWTTDVGFWNTAGYKIVPLYTINWDATNGVVAFNHIRQHHVGDVYFDRGGQVQVDLQSTDLNTAGELEIYNYNDGDPPTSFAGIQDDSKIPFNQLGSPISNSLVEWADDAQIAGWLVNYWGTAGYPWADTYETTATHHGLRPWTTSDWHGGGWNLYDDHGVGSDNYQLAPGSYPLFLLGEAHVGGTKESYYDRNNILGEDSFIGHSLYVETALNVDTINQESSAGPRIDVVNTTLKDDWLVDGITNAGSKDTGALVLTDGGLGVEQDIYAGGAVITEDEFRVEGAVDNHWNQTDVKIQPVTSIDLQSADIYVQGFNDIELMAGNDLDLTWSNDIVIQGNVFSIVTIFVQVGGAGPPRNVEVIGRVL